jgi:hypothetical protein
VPQVASDPKIHSHGHTTPRQARPAQQADRAASPFESLLDDGASPPWPNHRDTGTKQNRAGRGISQSVQDR